MFLDVDMETLFVIIKKTNALIVHLLIYISMRQTRLPIEWVTSAEADSSESVSSEEEKVPARKAAPLQWTRVKSLEQIRSQKIMVFDSEKDLQFDKSQKILRAELNHNRGTFIFDPDDFKGQAQSMTVESFRLPQEGLLEYAKLATQLR